MSFLLLLDDDAETAAQAAPLYLRIFQHLLPDAEAWRIVVNKTLRKFFLALAKVPEDAREFVDNVHLDLFASTTRELGAWLFQHGLTPAASTATQRAQLDAAWKANGGQSPRYLQDVMQGNGFDVFIHEFWEAGDPRDYTEVPLIGTTQCGEALAQCGEADAQCNRFLANEVGYLWNLNLTDMAPPPVPSDPDTWPYFLYWGGEAFPNTADVPAARRAEFEQLLLKYKPTGQWLVTLINYV